MSIGIKVAELNTLSDGKGITGIQVFNEMEDTNESTNLRKLADVWMSKNRCCQGHRNRSACLCHSSRITVDIAIAGIGHPNHLVSRAQSCRKLSVFTKLDGQKPSKSSSESESGVHCCHAAVKTRQNLKE